MEEIQHQLIGSVYHYLQGSYMSRGCLGFLPSTDCLGDIIPGYNTYCSKQKSFSLQADREQTIRNDPSTRQCALWCGPDLEQFTSGRVFKVIVCGLPEPWFTVGALPKTNLAAENWPKLKRKLILKHPGVAGAGMLVLGSVNNKKRFHAWNPINLDYPLFQCLK